ncbi:JAB domain-containing protein [Bariatricus sp. SGI.161]|uniref:JAB domain-containing protein n=1 Tax=Bariatricus sp. SGI.161 TaxID=3420550 RepID=UPI003D0184EE
MQLLEKNYVPLVRIHAVKEQNLPYGKRQLNTTQEVVEFSGQLLKDADREYVLVLSVDTKCAPVGIEVVSIGTLNQALIEPREIFKHAVLSNALGVFIIHNHPSGDVTPSTEDRLVTERLENAGKILGIKVLDHIILGEYGTFYSLAEEKRREMELCQQM